MPRWALLAAVSGLCILAPSRAATLHPISLPAPEFIAEAPWINAKPLTLELLRGRRAVLVAFINVANINSLRTLKILNRWWAAYAFHGLMIVGVHSAEYEFQKNPSSLRHELRRLGVRFPVVVDDERQLWKAYGNEGWPTFFLIDHRGRIVYDQVGEGRYRQLEAALRETMAGAGYRQPLFAPLAENPPSKDCGVATKESSAIGGEEVKPRAKGKIDSVLAGREGELTRRGDWLYKSDGLALASKNPRLSASLRFLYRGAEGHAVFGPADGKPTRFFIKQDDLWLHAGNAGGDILFDEEGRSYVDVDQPRLYRLTQNVEDNPHLLDVLPAQPGAAVYAFSFSDRCLKYVP